MALLSVVIPCYNSADYLPEAIASVKAFPDQDILEIIIVNDGSTDQPTIDLLRQLEDAGCVVINQENKGPAAARNTGIAFSESEYILFLDSDNKIHTTYIEQGLAVLRADKGVGVVYGDASFFGDTDATEPRFQSRKFSRFDIFYGNYIDMCSMIRKSVWQEVGGLDENRILIGHEDWDFWIRISATKWKFHYIPEVLFDYRIRNNSLIKQATESTRYERMLEYVRRKNVGLLLENYTFLHEQFDYYTRDKKRPTQSFIKYFYHKYLAK